MTVIRPMSTPGEQRCARGRGPPCSGFAVEGRVFAIHSAGARCTGGCLPRRAVVRCRSGPSVAPDVLLRGAGQHRSSELRLSGTRRGGDRGHQPEPRRVPRSPRATWSAATVGWRRCGRSGLVCRRSDSPTRRSPRWSPIATPTSVETHTAGGSTSSISCCAQWARRTTTDRDVTSISSNGRPTRHGRGARSISTGGVAPRRRRVPATAAEERVDRCAACWPNGWAPCSGRSGDPPDQRRSGRSGEPVAQRAATPRAASARRPVRKQRCRRDLLGSPVHVVDCSVRGTQTTCCPSSHR